MIKLKKLEAEIYMILKEIPITRTDDHLLYVAYWSKKRPDVSFIDFWKNYKAYRASSYASVERCRRKIQERYPQLKEMKTAEKRYTMVERYEQYALEG
jgi:hypothetical protein